MKSNRCHCKGQSLVEFALVVPVLLLIMLGLIEFGRAWMTKNIMTGAAREGVRVAAVPPPSGSMAAAQARAASVLASVGIPTDNIVVMDAPADYGEVSVTVHYDLPLLYTAFFFRYIPGFNSDNPTFPISSTTTMRREY